MKWASIGGSDSADPTNKLINEKDARSSQQNLVISGDKDDEDVSNAIKIDETSRNTQENAVLI